MHGAAVDFDALRTELQVPQAFPKTVEAAAADVAAHHTPAAADYTVATDLDLVTVDPTGSRDLDQAFALERRGDGFRLWYAIADVAAFIRSGDAVDAEAWRRGETRYCPDRSIPLHPVSLSEGAASLLPEKIRPAALWRIDLDGAGEIVPGGVEVRRSLVRSRAQLSYDGLTDLLRTRRAPAPAALLPVVGRLRLEAARRRHAIDLPIPEQRVVPAHPTDPNGRYTVEFRRPLDVETWNAQLSLVTGMAAANLMIDGGVGLLRTLPAPPPASVDRLRAAALALGVPWPDGETVGDVLAWLDPSRPAAAAFASLSAELLRGTGYRAVRRRAAPGRRARPRRHRRALRARHGTPAPPRRPPRHRGLPGALHGGHRARLGRVGAARAARRDGVVEQGGARARAGLRRPGRGVAAAAPGR